MVDSKNERLGVMCSKSGTLIVNMPPSIYHSQGLEI